MSDKVTRIRRLLAEAKPSKRPDSPQETASRAFRAYADNDPLGYVIDQTPRARTYREVIRLATTYSWQVEIDRALDDAHAMSLSTLSDDQLESLLRRLRNLEDCLHTAIGPPDAPPAY